MVTNENFGDFVGQPRIKKIKEGLKKCGLKAEDINFAVEVAFWIEILDSLVFADTLPILFYRWRSYRGAIVSHHPLKKYYIIFVPGLYKRMKKEWQRQLVYITKNKTISYPLSRANKKKIISWREAMIGVAAHEVRHRIQNTPGFRVFTDKNPRLAGTAWTIYKKLVGKKRITKKDMLSLELSTQRDDRKKSKIKLIELDAKIIEGLAINLCHIGSSIAKIAAAIKIQPGMVAASA